MQRMLSPERYWLNLQRILPRALAPTLVAVQAAAPRGRTSKLARGFDLRVLPVSQGLIHGVHVDILARVPYGHLIHGGHRKVARGPQRKDRKLTKNRRRELRTALILRRGTILGRVPANPFAARALQQQLPQTLASVEVALQAALERPV